MKKVKQSKMNQRHLGLKCTHKLIHPEYVLFADEVGSNTNKKENRNYGGEKRLAKRGSTPKKICFSSDAHWTLLGLTDANGLPVMRGILFKGGTLTPEEYSAVISFQILLNLKMILLPTLVQVKDFLDHQDV